MNREEKILLLQLILEDIRGNWGWELWERVSKAKELAEELELEKHIEHINEFRDIYNYCGTRDGRHFRTDCENGGYIGMDRLYNLNKTIKDKSDKFKLEVSILTYPEYRFDDWEDYDYNFRKLYRKVKEC